MEKLKVNSIGSTICLTSSKKSGGEGRIKTWEAQGSISGMWSTHQVCHGEHTQSWDHKGKGCWELRALGQLPHTISLASHTPLHNSHTHTCTELHFAMANFTQHKRPA